MKLVLEKLHIIIANANRTTVKLAIFENKGANFTRHASHQISYKRNKLFQHSVKNDRCAAARLFIIKININKFGMYTRYTATRILDTEWCI